ncbi:MAG TPA: HAD hydrolase-like protein [Kineosporiaceae bacterium]|nr:HAD hydrolase-like protein [Kineosporiaceae bacterium]
MPDDQLVVGFDLDLTLVDSADGIAATFSAAVAACPGGEAVQITRAQIWPYIGLPLEATAAGLVPQLDPDRVVREYRSRYAQIGVPLTRLLPGAEQALRAVREAGGRLLVVSAKAEVGVRDVLTEVGLDAPDVRPDLVVGGLFGAAKGERLIIEGADVYVGDHPGDVQAARVAGALSVVVCTGPESAATLAAAGADVILDDLLGFPKWLATFLPGFRRSRVRN